MDLNFPLHKALEILLKAEREGRSLEDGMFRLELYNALSSELAFAKLSGATVAALLGQDASIAAQTSTNAVENNAIMLAVGIGFAVYEVYDVIKIWQREGPGAALQKIAIDGTITLATLGTGKVVYRVAGPMAEMVWQAYMAENPVFAQVAAKVFAPITTAFTKAKELYQVADTALDTALAKGLQKLTRKEAPKPPILESESLVSSLDLAETRPLVAYDYTTTEAAYSLRIDPLTGKGPMAVDSNLFTSATSHTVNGAKRNKDQFWKLWQEKYPETISKENLNLLDNRLAPKVDQQWVIHFPEHYKFKEEILVHHHIDHSIFVTPLPESLHNRYPGRTIFHTNLGGKKKND